MGRVAATVREFACAKLREKSVIAKKQVVRRFDNDASNLSIEKELANKTPISRTANHVMLACPVCSIQFSRKASEAKRNAVNYCGRGCQGVAQRVQVKVECKVCGAPFTVKKSSFERTVCCSNECARKSQSEKTSISNRKMWRDGIFGVGENHPNAKITNDQAVSAFVDMRKHQEIADELNVTRSEISRIKRVGLFGNLNLGQFVTP